MEEGWVKILSSTDVFFVELANALLKEHEIEAVIINKQDPMYLFGEAELYTKKEHALMAKQLIKTSDL